MFYIENLPGGLFSMGDAFLYDTCVVAAMMLIVSGSPLSCGFPCRFSRRHDISFILCNNDLGI